MTEDRYLTVDDLVERLRACRSSIFSWAKQGLMPKQIKLERMSRWSEREIEEWLASRPRGAYGEDRP